jgi:hypothetical protein
MAQSKHRRRGKVRPRRPEPLGRSEFYAHERQLDAETRTRRGNGVPISLRLPKPKPPSTPSQE